MFEDLKREDVMWLAGFYEGEGCLHIKKGKTTQGVIQIVSTDKDVLEKVVSIFPLFKWIKKPRTQAHYKDQWVVFLRQCDSIYAFCCIVYPFLGKRRKEKIEEFIKLYSDGIIRRRALYDRGQKCNVCSESLKPYNAAKGRCRNCYERLRRRTKKLREVTS